MSRAKVKFFLGAAAGMAVLTSAAAWVPEPTDVWPDGDVPVAIELQATTALNGPWNSAAAEAMALWNAYLQRIQLKSAPTTGRPWYDNGRNELFFDTKVYGEFFPSGVVAVTGVTSDHGTRVEADIVFRTDLPWAVYHGAAQREVELRRVAVHELGHLLGLSHPDQAGQSVPAIMNSILSDIETPTADDRPGCTRSMIAERVADR